MLYEEEWPEVWRRGQWPLLRTWLFSPPTYDRLREISSQPHQELPPELSYFLDQLRPPF